MFESLADSADARRPVINATRAEHIMTMSHEKPEQAKAELAGYTQSEIEALPAIIGKHEVARIACVSERTVTREASKGNLHGSFRIGNQWRFNTNAICAQFGQLR